VFAKLLPVVMGPGLRRDDGGEAVCAPHQRRHCERSEKIQNPSAVTVWIASLRSQ